MEQLKIFGRDQRLRTSTVIPDNPDRGEEQHILRGESDGLSSSTPRQDDSPWYDGQAKRDFWSVAPDVLHLSPSRGTQSQTVHAGTRIISYSAEIYRRYQKYLYITGCNAGEDIDDYWNVDGDRDLSDTWTGFTRITKKKEKPQEMGVRGPERDWPGLTKLCPEMWKHMSDASKRKEKQKWAIEKPKLDNARRLCGIYFIDLMDEELKDIMKNACIEC